MQYVGHSSCLYMFIHWDFYVIYWIKNNVNIRRKVEILMKIELHVLHLQSEAAKVLCIIKVLCRTQLSAD